jgi:hypothetical protein
MKKILITLACALGTLTLIPTAEAGYRRTVMGYDLRGNPIIRVVWVADHLDYPRFYFNRRTYPTSWKKDWPPPPQGYVVPPERYVIRDR